mgnify:CR=1 FL=1
MTTTISNHFTKNGIFQGFEGTNLATTDVLLKQADDSAFLDTYGQSNDLARAWVIWGDFHNKFKIKDHSRSSQPGALSNVAWLLKQELSVPNLKFWEFGTNGGGAATGGGTAAGYTGVLANSLPVKRGYSIIAYDYSGVDQFKKQIYTPLLVPWYEKHRKNNSAVSEPAKLLYKEWFENPENLGIMKERFIKIMTTQPSDNIRLAGYGFFAQNGSVRLNQQAADILSAFTPFMTPTQASLDVNVADFIDDILNNTAKTEILIALGFDQVVEDVANNLNSMLGKTAESLDLATLERSLAEGREEAGELMEEALGESTEERKLALKQCALITFLLHEQNFTVPGQGSSNIGMKNYFQESTTQSPLGSTSYLNAQDDTDKNYRIYPVIPSATHFDPNQLVNICTVSKRLKKDLLKASKDSGPKMIKKHLFWVFSNEDGELKEIEIPLSSDQALKEKAGDRTNLKKALRILQSNKGTPAERNSSAQYYANQAGVTDLSLVASTYETKTREIVQDTNTVKNGYHYIENIRINFDGTNPSTARNDVKVEMTFILSGLSQLDKNLVQGIYHNDMNNEYDVKLMDLITLPITKTPQTSKSAAGFIPNQYDPSYSRVRLKVRALGDSESNLIIDLTTIDHKIDRDSGRGEVKLTINYRGYFESVLNMPYNDALATNSDITTRKEIADTMNEIVYGPDKCNPEAIRNAMRMQQAYLGRDNRSLTASSLIDRLFVNNNIHQYTLDPTLTSLLDSYVDPRNQYIKSVDLAQNLTAASLGAVTGEAANLQKEMSKEKKDQDEDVIEKAKSNLKNKFFFLGDLMYHALDCLYEQDTCKHRDHVEHLNLRFIVGTCYVPNPKNLSEAMCINPISLPVDLLFFLEWFNSSVISKGLRFYPVGTFIKDLIERMVNGVIYDTCFALTLPDENPPIFRTTTFVNTNDNSMPPWFHKLENKTIATRGTYAYNRGFFNPRDPQNTVGPQCNVPTNITPDILMKRTYDPNKKGVNDVYSKQYNVIYQQFPSFLRQMKASNSSQNKTHLRDTEYCPTIYYGQGNEQHNYISNVSFAKTTSPFLREARYFNSNFGGLSLLSNVYDLDFDFQGRVGNTMFYPGTILNFILNDFSGKSFKANELPHSKITFDANLNSDYSFFGNSNPHERGNLANIMGMGGYYIVKSVEYNLATNEKDFTIKISTKFLGNDADNSPERPDESKEKNKKIENSAECVRQYNSLAERVNPTLAAGEEFFAKLEQPGASISGSAASQSLRASLLSTATITPVDALNQLINDKQGYKVSTVNFSTLKDGSNNSSVKRREEAIKNTIEKEFAKKGFDIAPLNSSANIEVANRYYFVKVSNGKITVKNKRQ